MSQALINRSLDLTKLQNEEYGIEICDGYLVIHHIPYLNRKKEIKSGTLVMSLTMAGNMVVKPKDHTAFFVGEQPSNLDGSFVPSLVNSASKQKLYADIVSDFYLSCYPDGRSGYTDYYDKVTTYYSIISSPAWNLNAEKCKQIKKPIIVRENGSSLVYMDTNASRANIAFFNVIFKSLKIAIVGLGGTGSYLLDFISKTPVSEIHLFDSDVFSTHNAFRAPGAASVDELEQELYKVEYLTKIYSHIHTGIISHTENITQDNVSVLGYMNYVFLCVDSVNVRNSIAGYLTDNKIPFIDSGLGINLSHNNKLIGLVRITTGFNEHYSHIKDIFNGNDVKDEVYLSNIQIAELNAMAAIYAVIKWKKMLGFYHDTFQEINSVYSIDNNDIFNEKV